MRVSPNLAIEAEALSNMFELFFCRQSCLKSSTAEARLIWRASDKLVGMLLETGAR
jgi:hypothetical protein